MKALICFFLSWLILFSVKSQWIEHIEVIPAAPTNKSQISIIDIVEFPLGYQLTCPPLSGYVFLKEGVNLSLNLYYDISGAWPLVGCYAIDTSAIGQIDAGSYELVVFLHTIFDNDTNFLKDTDTTQFSVINSSAIYNLQITNTISVYPNPTNRWFQISGLIFAAEGAKFIRIYNSLGLKVEELKMQDIEETIDVNVQGWPKGLYFIQLEIDSETIANTKIIVR